MSRIPSLSRLFSNPTIKCKFLGFIDLSFSGASFGIGTFIVIAILAALSNAIVYTAVFSACVGQLFNIPIEIFDWKNMLSVWGLFVLINAATSSS